MATGQTERRLAAILSADVVGYSRLMAEDEGGTARTLAAYRDEIGLLVRQHRGRVVDSPGDNLLAEFPTGTDAVECAVEIQRVISARNAALPADRRMGLRIGVHLGEITFEADRVYGNGVNIAARLQALAEPGGICVSGAVQEQVGKKLAVAYRDLGAQSLKNIPEPVRAYGIRVDEPAASRPRARRLAPRAVAALVGAALLVIAAVAYLTLDRRAPTEAGAPLTSIAVLPFDDMSPGGDQKWLADGMAEELIETLSRIEALRVIARTSAFSLKGKDIETVGEELQVGAVVEGSVRRSDDQLRVTAQLIRVSDGSHLWSARYDRKLADVFAIQSEIARAIAEAVRGELGIEYDYSFLRNAHAPSDVRAYELMKKANDVTYAGWTEAGIRKAIDYARQALVIDPDYADAHAGLGYSHLYLWRFYGRAETDLAVARAQGERALAMDPANEIAHSLLAELLFSRYEWDEARAFVDRGLAHNPGNGGLRFNSGVLFASQGRIADGIAEMRHAVELDPRWSAAHVGLGAVLLVAGAPRDALEPLERAWDLGGAPQLRGILAYAYHQSGRDDEALEAAVRGFPLELAELEGDVRRGYAESGFEGLLRAQVAWRVAKRGDPCTTWEGQEGTADLALLGQTDALFECLDQVINRGQGPLFLKTFSVYDPYRSDPRFTALLQRMNLAE